MSTERHEEIVKDIDEQNRSEQYANCPPRINKTLLPNKLFYFFYGSGYGSIQVYLTLFFKQLWLPASSAGILFGVMHLWRFATGGLLSAIADKYQKRKLFLFLGMVIASISFILVTFTPVTKPVCTITTINSTIQGNKSGFIRGGGNTEYVKIIGVKHSQALNSGHFSFSVTFLYLLIVISISSFASSAQDPLCDTLTLQVLEGESDKIGFQRAGGGLGYGLAAFLIGAFLALQPVIYSCESGTDLNYKPAIYFGCILWLLGSITVFFMKEKPEMFNNSDGTFLISIRTSMTYKLCAVLFLAVYCGAMKSIIDSFLFWRLKEIGGKQILNSLIKGLQSVSELTGFLLAEFLIKRLGHFGVMYLSVACYAIQFLIYVLIQNPWLVFLSEWMPCLTFSAFLSSGISFIGLCPGAAATMQAFFSTGFLGLGFGIGPIIGGPLIDSYGISGVFSGCCISTVCVLILFIIATQLYIGKENNTGANTEVNKVGYKQIINQE